MRKRYSYRVCRCTPNEGVVQLETRLLRHIVNYRIRSIRCAQNSRMKYHFGLHLGQLCATSGHPECAVMERYAQGAYDFFWLEKYDYSRVEDED